MSIEDYKCSTCKHKAFDEVWGEVKCKKKMIRIYGPRRADGCLDYEEEKTEKKNTDDSKENE